MSSYKLGLILSVQSFLTAFSCRAGVKHYFKKMSRVGKGQLISKCPYKKSVSSKIPTKLFLDFCPEFFL